MPANTFKGPTVMYGPKGEFQTFLDSNEVPEGWTDAPPSANAAVAAKTAASNPALTMTRDEIVIALKNGNVDFKPNAPTGKLYAALGDALKGHLEAQEIAFDPDATVPELMKLLEA